MGLLSYRQRLVSLNAECAVTYRNFQNLNVFVSYGHKTFRNDTFYQTHNVSLKSSHHPPRSAHNFYNNRVIKYWNQLALHVRQSTIITAFN